MYGYILTAAISAYDFAIFGIYRRQYRHLFFT